MNPGILNPNLNPNPGTLNLNQPESESTPIFLNPNLNPFASNLNPSLYIGIRNLESGFESEFESTHFFLNPNPDSKCPAVNLNPNTAQKALNPDSDSHITASDIVAKKITNQVHILGT